MHIHVKKILNYLIMSILLYVQFLPIRAYKETRAVTVFIHGTLLPVFAFLNPNQTYTQTIHSTDWYTRCLKKIRVDPVLFEDSIVLQEGLHKIPTDILEQYKKQTLSAGQSKIGAYQAIGAYHEIYQHVYNNALKADYYTFGFLGLLSDTHRRETAHELYKSLVQLKTTYNEQAIEPVFTLIGYSHGGNVILYLPLAEARLCQKLQIETCVLLGTPLYQETAPYVEHVLFKNVYNIYSLGDGIQEKDTLSTPQGKSGRTLFRFTNTREINKLTSKYIYDIQLVVGKNTQVFGHFCLWSFNKYRSNFNWPHPHVQTIFNMLNPLPIAVVIPAITSLISAHNYKNHELTVSIELHNNQCVIKLPDYADMVSIHKPLQQAQDYALRSWKPYARSSESLLYTSTFWAVLKALIA
jgi:hypothetical protein